MLKSLRRSQAEFIFFVIGISGLCYYAGMLWVILKIKEDQKAKTNDPQV